MCTCWSRQPDNARFLRTVCERVGMGMCLHAGRLCSSRGIGVGPRPEDAGSRFLEAHHGVDDVPHCRRQEQILRARLRNNLQYTAIYAFNYKYFRQFNTLAASPSGQVLVGAVIHASAACILR
jgi:hypothetical protein